MPSWSWTVLPLPPGGEDYAATFDDGLTAGKACLLEAHEEKWCSEGNAVRKEKSQLADSVYGTGWVSHEGRNVVRNDRLAVRRIMTEPMFREKCLFLRGEECVHYDYGCCSESFDEIHVQNVSFLEVSGNC